MFRKIVSERTSGSAGVVTHRTPTDNLPVDLGASLTIDRVTGDRPLINDNIASKVKRA